MILYHSLHIKDGAVARLTRSSSDSRQAEILHPDPVARAQAFEAEGFPWLHVVDLDGAFTESETNNVCIENILKNIKIPLQLSGGIHDMRAIEFWINKGVQRIVLTSAAQQNPVLVREAAARFPGRIALCVSRMRVSTRLFMPTLI